MTKQNNERAFQNFIKDTIRAEGGWYSQLHPGMSSDFGIPDLLTAVESVGILPAELKIGTIEGGDTVWSTAIRPTQIAWHTRLTQHGYLSCIMIGIPAGKSWRIFVVDGMEANKVRDGFIIGKDAKEIDPRFFLEELNQWAIDNDNSYED